ncbi:BAHD acyltransferase [Acorus calamus]|uniref:BAHD acyltransferase n=1 Tax=Acorus calamus TaxID=4465 RepID=A0AAV9D2D1_ACOCL|nr:BAHD acyltransferase [Acorus calamus]
MSHKLADGASYAEFLNAWAETARARGVPQARRPKFDAATLFPPRDVAPEIEFMPAAQSMLAPARLLFRVRQLETLRGAAYAREPHARPTRVEAVITLLWRCAMRAAVGEARKRRPEVAVPVNLRGRLRLTEDYFGNVFANVYASGGGGRVGAEEHEQGFLEGRLREAIRGLNGEAREELRTAVAVAEGVERYLFTSWCRFPFYETDFGWGGPAWVALPPYGMKNWFALMNARDGDGFEVWAFLTEAEMEGFAKDPELLAFTSSPNGIYSVRK